LDNLEKIVICEKCCTPHLKKELNPDEVAICYKCGNILYKKYSSLAFRLFSLSFSSFIFFLISILYPVISIDIGGYKGELNIIDTIVFLFKEGYLFLAFFTLMSIVIFPLILILATFMFSIMRIFKINRKFSKDLLVLITIVKDFVYIDIFFIAILVSLVKIFEYGYIIYGVGFMSFTILFLLIIYMFKFINISAYWELLDV
jgi:paraquat-inducible protein A